MHMSVEAHRIRPASVSAKDALATESRKYEQLYGYIIGHCILHIGWLLFERMTWIKNQVKEA